MQNVHLENTEFVAVKSAVELELVLLSDFLKSM